MKKLLLVTSLMFLFGITNAQKMYNGSGKQIGRVDGDRYYDGSGRFIGRIDGDRIYDGSGRFIGRADGMRRMQINFFLLFYVAI